MYSINKTVVMYKMDKIVFPTGVLAEKLNKR